MIGLILLIILVIYVVVAKYIYKSLKDEFSNKKYISKLVLAFFILLPTYDIFITYILSGYYCLTTPSTYIEKKVEYPESIYWEDNVYPGFNDEDRKLMIMNYLDGVHLKRMALNGDDEKVYVYEIDKNIYKDLKHNKEKYKYKHEQYANIILKTQKIYTKQTMPKMNYTVTFNEIELNSFTRKFLYSDETKVIDNKDNEVVAYNRRYMRFAYNIFPDIALGDIYYVQGSMCGSDLYFERKVIQTNGLYAMRNHKIWLNKKLYKKYIKGEK